LLRLLLILPSWGKKLGSYMSRVFRRPATIARAARTLVAASCLAFAGTAAAQEQHFETKAVHAILIDAESDTILFQKGAEEKTPPASMAKLMTMAVVFDAIHQGKLSLDTEFEVSENAWRSGGATSGGSTMFAKVHSTIAVRDLIRGVIIQSGNDACITLAEGMAGTEQAFAGMMNAEARKLGLTGSHFMNATGLPDPEQYVTVHDLARLAKHLIYDYPEFYPIYSETEFVWNKIRQHNRNPLLEMNIGADGLKTGFTEESGYGLVGSAVREGQRLIMVINGTKSEKERAEEARKLMDWGLRAFERVELFRPGETIAEASVFGGAKSSVGVMGKGGVVVLLPRGSRDLVKGRLVYQGPVPAPIEAGQQIGALRIMIGDQVLKETPVFAEDDVAEGSIPQRSLDSIKELLLGWW
jgi:D-alanyl-D-alanine carboxypeptidase (penicillin-binding protein 5/6)